MHWPVDIHCDHVMSSASAWRAVLFAGLRDSCEIYFHEQTVQSRTFRPSVFVDVSRVQERKEKVIRLYKSQSPDVLVDRRRTDAKFLGWRIGVKYAEAFAVADGTVKGGGILAGLASDQGVVSLQRPGQRAYFAMERIARENAFSNAAFRATMLATGDRPAPVVICWGAGTPPYTVTVTKGGERVWSTTSPMRSAEVYNLEIARAYEWRAVDAKGIVVGEGRFRTADEVPRFISVPGVPNVRDLGGRIGLNGRRIRQGLVYRSAGWNNNASSCVLTNGAVVMTNMQAGASRLNSIVADVFVKPLGIRTDLDLRSDRECFGMTGSPIGKDVRWLHIPGGNYWNFSESRWQAAFAEAFRAFLDEANYPIVFHCIAGADRTGSLACILNALLGVCEDELAKDWEATGFDNAHPKLRHDIRWDPLVKVFDAYPGSTLNERVESYVKARGFSDADIARFRAIMLEEKR
jgi:protein-tyrosine phosphatase